MKITKSILIIAAIFSFLPSGILSADDAVAKAKYDEALQYFADRDDLKNVEKAIELLSIAEKEAGDSDLKYDVLVLAARALYWKGTHTAGDKNKVVIHDQGYKKAEAARAVNGDYAEALFWSATNLGRWGKANGVVASLSRKKELIATTEGIFERNTRDGQPGETYDGYGANRLLGKLYFELPAFAGGNHALALKHLDIAYTKARSYATNVNYYAEILYAGDAGQKKKAKEILDELLKQDPTKYNPVRPVETGEEFTEAKRIRAEMGR